MEPASTTSGRLKDFAVTLFESLEGIVEPVEDDLIEVLLPPEPGGRLSPHLKIAFDPEVVPEVPGAEFLTYGSALLDDLVGLAGELGTVSRIYPTGINMLDASNIERNLKRQIRFEGGDAHVIRTKVKLFTYLLFTFEIRYTTDEREEEFISVVVNLYNGQIARRLMDVLKDPARHTEENYLICPEAESLSTYQAYRIALEEVERKMIASLNLRKTAMGKLIQQESFRIHNFYRDNDRELLERIEKEKAKSTDADRIESEKRIQALEHKRRVNEIERQRRLQETLDTYTLRVSVRLINLLQIACPKMVNTVAVVEPPPKRSLGEARQAATSVIWDPLLRCPEPPTCSQCGKTTMMLRLVCPPKSHPQLVCGEC